MVTGYWRAESDSNSSSPMPPSPSSSSRIPNPSASQVWSLLQSNPSPQSLERLLSLSLPPPTPSLITSVLSSPDSNSSPLLSLRFFLWSSLHTPLRPSLSLISSASSVLRIPDRPHLLHHLLSSLPPSSVSLPTFSLLLRLSSPLFPLSLYLLRRMPHFSLRPHLPIFNSLLRLSPSPSVSAQIFHELTLSSLRPDLISYLHLITSFSSANLLSPARQTLSLMRAHGCVPNVAVYTAVLDCACSLGDLASAEEILREMEAPNVVSYTCLVKCLCGKGMLDEALAVVDQMGRNGCRPNRVTLRTLIQGFCDRRRLDDAYGFIKEKLISTDGNGFSSEECYSLLVSCLLRTGDRRAAEGLLKRMVAMGVRPDGLACNSFMRELCEKRMFSDAYKWVAELEEKGFFSCVDSDVCSSLLEGLCREGSSAEAVELARWVVDSDTPVGPSCADAVVTMLEQIGSEGDLASQILRLKVELESSVP